MEHMGKSRQWEQFYESVYWLLHAIRLGDNKAKQRLENAKADPGGCEFTPESAWGFHNFIVEFEKTAPEIVRAAVH